MEKNTDTQTMMTATLNEAKIKRREYARAYYAAHKDKMKDAVKKCRGQEDHGEEGTLSRLSKQISRSCKPGLVHATKE